MKKLLAIIAAAALLPIAAAAEKESSASERLQKAAMVLNEAKATIPADTLDDAQCIAVLPNVKRGAFLFSATYGAGFASCRTPGGWSAPAGIDMRAGSVGLQAGGQETDYIILVMGDTARYRLINNDLRFDASAKAAAGTSGPATDESRRDVIVWARSGGAFAGVDVGGARLSQDDSANKALYGYKAPNAMILEGRVASPPAAQPFERALAGREVVPHAAVQQGRAPLTDEETTAPTPQPAPKQYPPTGSVVPR